MIQGSLRDAAIADVFQIISAGHKTGLLTVVHDETEAHICFDQGKVQFASLAPGIHLGEILVRMELLTAYEVQEILLKQQAENPGMPLGAQAVELGFITADELKGALKAQALEVLTELMDYRSGTFSFSEGQSATMALPLSAGFDAQMLLMEVAARIEVWQDGKIDPEAVFERDGDPTKLDLPRGAWEVLGYVDGRRSAASIAAELDLPEREVYRILFELSRRGIIGTSPFQVDEPVVLVVAASSGLRRIMRLALRRARLKPILASDFDAAMSALTQHRPQAIVVDDAGGAAWDFVRDHRRQRGKGHLPVLMLVAAEPPSGLFARFKTRRVRLLKKPFQEIELQKAVCTMVGSPL